MSTRSTKSRESETFASNALFGGQRVFPAVLSYLEGEEVAQVAPTSVATSCFCERALQLNYVWNVSTSIVHTNKLNRCEMEYASKSGAYSNKDQYQLVGMFRDRTTAMEQAW